MPDEHDGAGSARDARGQSGREPSPEKRQRRRFDGSRAHGIHHTGRDMNGGAALFLFLATGANALFTFLSMAPWRMLRAAERKDLERFALLRKLAEQPTDSARLALEVLRDDDAKVEQKQRKRSHQTRLNTLESSSGP